MEAIIISIGNELIDGTVADTNSRYISESFTRKGIKPVMSVCTGDNIPDILNALEFAGSRMGNEGFIVITGGIGPTADDLTREAVALFTGFPLVLKEDLASAIRERFKRLSIEMPEQNIRQAYIPEGAEVLENHNGSAPGFYLRTRKGYGISVFPGVPFEFIPMFDGWIDGIKDNIRTSLVTVRAVGIAESYIDGKLSSELPSDMEFGTVARVGRIDLRFNVFEKDRGIAEKRVDDFISGFPDIYRKIYSFGKDMELSGAVVDELKRKGRTAGIAESCTGGLISKMITDIAGSSKVFYGGAVVYADHIKEKLLSIEKSVLKQYGAVSFETVFDMLNGVRELLQTDYCIAVSGIAGPGGGSDDKPVGTVFIGVSDGSRNFVGRFVFSGNRAVVRERSAVKALELLWEILRYKNINTDNQTSLKEAKISGENNV
jgi:nicotinamide-nucleotide amidase